jgi:hypothetical protein
VIGTWIKMKFLQGVKKCRQEDRQLGFFPNSKVVGVEMQKQGKIHYFGPLFRDFKNLNRCNIPNIILGLINAYVDIMRGYCQSGVYVNCISMF